MVVYYKAIEMGVPDHTACVLDEYISKNVEVGGFLKHVLSNDLMGAFGAADSTNMLHMKEIVSFLYNYAPGDCWGSKESYTNWIKKGAKQ
jgi:hypothetical protein